MGTTTVSPVKPEASSNSDDGGRGRGRHDEGWFGGGWEGRSWTVPARTYRTGMWMALVAIVMLFAAFTSALVVRRGISTDWVPTSLPSVLYLNTLVLLTSSLTMELSRRFLVQGQAGQFARWLYVTLGLGLAFLAGQLMAWRRLASEGVYLATNPSSSFFYLLTGAHGIHLLGGVVALFYLALGVPNIAAGSRRWAAVDVTAIYWHFMDGLWIYILLLLKARL